MAQSVERLTGIPVSDMGANDIEHLKNLDKRLKSKVIGQDEAVKMVAKAIRRNRAGFQRVISRLEVFCLWAQLA